MRKRITALQQQLPAAYQLRTEYDATQYIEENLQRIGIQSGFAVMILFLFVLLTTRSWRYMGLIGVSMAVCLLLSVILFYAFNVEIHLYSLAALTTSLGIIIDNVIVMIDHYRRYRNLKVFSALLGATLTTCAGLAVIWFLPDEARIDLLDFAVVMVITLGVSLVVAVGFVPALMATSPRSGGMPLRPSQPSPRWRGVRVEALYRDILHLLVRFRKTVIVAGILLLVPLYFCYPIS